MLLRLSRPGGPRKTSAVKQSDGSHAARTRPRAEAAPGQDRGEEAKTCPSALCEEDALLLGVVTPDGTVAYVQPPTRVSAEFVGRARALGHPERRFRFAGRCVEAGCPQWTGRGCGVVDIAIGAAPTEPAPPGAGPREPGGPDSAAARPALPACVIRRSCRWYAQRGAAACAVCPLVVADTGGTLTCRSAGLTPDSG
jgi:hypothetical protein